MTPEKENTISNIFNTLTANGEAPRYKDFVTKVVDNVPGAPSESWLSKKYTILKKAIQGDEYKRLKAVWHLGLLAGNKHPEYQISGEAISYILKVQKWIIEYKEGDFNGEAITVCQAHGEAITVCQALWIARLYNYFKRNIYYLWSASFVYAGYELNCVLNNTPCDTTKFDHCLLKNSWESLVNYGSPTNRKVMPKSNLME